AILVSNLYWRLFDLSMKPLSVEEAFYMLKEGGGSFFGKVGSFKEGFEFDAVVLNDSTIPTPLKLSPKDRLERLIYLS
ncbi:guanine deaminase, partial [Blautia wexlerae]|nr:guanine deaminase [Blautia wexlerae]